MSSEHHPTGPTAEIGHANQPDLLITNWSSADVRGSFPFAPATLLLVSACVLLFLWTPADLVYLRANPHIWQFFSAPLMHYDLRHLVPNILALSVLGWLFEARGHRATLCALFVAAGPGSVLALHLALPEYSTYAGISVVNYALLAWLLACQLHASPKLVAAISCAVCLWQISNTGLLPGDSSISSTWQPVAELHLAAILAGAGAAALTLWFTARKVRGRCPA